MRRLRVSRSDLGLRNLGFDLAAANFPQARQSVLRQGGDRGGQRCNGAGRGLGVERAVRREASGWEASLTVFFVELDPVFECRTASTVIVGSARCSSQGRWLGYVDGCFDLNVSVLRRRSRLFLEGGGFQAVTHGYFQLAVFIQTSVDGLLRWAGRPPELMAAKWQQRSWAPVRSSSWAWFWAWVSGPGLNFGLMGQTTLVSMKQASKKEKVKRVFAGMSSTSKGEELVNY